MGNCLITRKGESGFKYQLSTVGNRTASKIVYGDTIDTKNTSKKTCFYEMCFAKESGETGYALIEGSNDNSTWTTLKKAESNISVWGATGENGTFETNYRYIRIKGYVTQGGSRQRITVLVGGVISTLNILKRIFLGEVCYG